MLLISAPDEARRSSRSPSSGSSPAVPVAVLADRHPLPLRLGGRVAAWTGAHAIALKRRRASDRAGERRGSSHGDDDGGGAKRELYDVASKRARVLMTSSGDHLPPRAVA